MVNGLQVIFSEDGMDYAQADILQKVLEATKPSIFVTLNP